MQNFFYIVFSPFSSRIQSTFYKEKMQLFLVTMDLYIIVYFSNLGDFFPVND